MNTGRIEKSKVGRKRATRIGSPQLPRASDYGEVKVRKDAGFATGEVWAQKEAEFATGKVRARKEASLANERGQFRRGRGSGTGEVQAWKGAKAVPNGKAAMGVFRGVWMRDLPALYQCRATGSPV